MIGVARQPLGNQLSKPAFATKPVSLLLVAVMAITDEVDSQFVQAMTKYVKESQADTLPVLL
jgi:hypothetical protein